MRLPVAIALVAAPLVLAACSSTSLVSERAEPGATDGPWRRIAVIGVSEDVPQRIRFEKAFASALERRASIDATPATALVEPERSLDHDLLQSALEGRGFDGLLVVRKLGERVDVKEFRTGGIPEIDVSAYDDFHGRYLRTIQSGTTENATRTVRLEVSLLRADDYREAWIGATDSRDPREMDRVADELADVVVDRLRAHRIL